MNRKYLMALMGLALIIAFVGGYGIAQLTVTRELPTTANLITDVTLSVYEDIDTIIEMTNIDWQNILPTETKTIYLFIQNNADIPLTISITTKDWLPIEVEDHLTFSYEKGANVWEDALHGTYPVLNPHMRAGIKISLFASENATAGAFSFTVVIHGTTI